MSQLTKRSDLDIVLSLDKSDVVKQPIFSGAESLALIRRCLNGEEQKLLPVDVLRCSKMSDASKSTHLSCETSVAIPKSVAPKTSDASFKGDTVVDSLFAKCKGLEFKDLKHKTHLKMPQRANDGVKPAGKKVLESGSTHHQLDSDVTSPPQRLYGVVKRPRIVATDPEPRVTDLRPRAQWLMNNVSRQRLRFLEAFPSPPAHLYLPAPLTDSHAADNRKRNGVVSLCIRDLQCLFRLRGRPSRRGKSCSFAGRRVWVSPLRLMCSVCHNRSLSQVVPCTLKELLSLCTHTYTSDPESFNIGDVRVQATLWALYHVAVKYEALDTLESFPTAFQSIFNLKI